MGVAGCGFPSNSIYGVCAVIPQIAREPSWHSVFAGKVVQSFIVLVLSWGLQGMFIYQLYNIDSIRNQACEKNPAKCLAEGFRKTRASISEMGLRWHLCTPV